MASLSIIAGRARIMAAARFPGSVGRRRVDAAVQRERSYDTTAIDLKFTSFVVRASQLTNLRACGGGRVLAALFSRFLGSLPRHPSGSLCIRTLFHRTIHETSSTTGRLSS